MTAYTPGPWRVKWTARGRCDGIAADYHDHEGTDCYDVQAYGCPYQKEIVTTDSGFYGPEPADARLIGAAPDLYAALKAILTDSPDTGFTRLTLENCRAAHAAIAKAEGAK